MQKERLVTMTSMILYVTLLLVIFNVPMRFTVFVIWYYVLWLIYQ
jgi:hypothetical protein